jgi:hypothetical protein
MKKKLPFFLVTLTFAALLVLPGIGWAAGGTGNFNAEIHWWWSGDLYYSVAGGPASTCGTLWAYRNAGPWTSTPGWLCTDASGNAIKGPWSWANQNGDEDALGFIEWPDGSTTTVAHHIWDKTAPSVSPIPTPPPGSPPSSLTGSASDGSYGAGFNSLWAYCSVTFKDTGTGLYWTPSSGGYNTSTNSVSCTISGMPSRSVTWSAPQIPPSTAHTSGHCYEWQVCLYDGGFCGYSPISFCT